MQQLENLLAEKLKSREKEGLLRSLKLPNNGVVDFASNDYLGFSKVLKEKLEVKQFNNTSKQFFTSSSGSRLLTGNSLFAEQLEKQIADHHEAESALLFNSGYDANLGFFSCMPQKGHTVFYDELIHASVRDGMRLGLADNVKFRHNDLADLEKKLQRNHGQKYVAVESVYSMDGDFSPLEEIAVLCDKYNAALVVDEAHATGIYGANGAGRVQELGLQAKVFARLHTFGKALGSHGAAIVGSELLRGFMINYCRPFIYSTAQPIHSLHVIKLAYEELSKSENKKLYISRIINLFKEKINDKILTLLPSDSPIQCIIISGNDEVKKAALKLQQLGFLVLPVLSPTVKPGKERLRVCLHAFNSEEEVIDLTNAINNL